MYNIFILYKVQYIYFELSNLLILIKKLGDPERCHNQLNYIRLDYITMHTFYYTGITNELKNNLISKIFRHMLDYIM